MIYWLIMYVITYLINSAGVEKLTQKLQSLINIRLTSTYDLHIEIIYIADHNIKQQQE